MLIVSEYKIDLKHYYQAFQVYFIFYYILYFIFKCRGDNK